MLLQEANHSAASDFCYIHRQIGDDNFVDATAYVCGSSALLESLTGH